MRSRLLRFVASLVAAAAVSFAVPAYAAGMLSDGAGLSSGAGVAIGCDADGVSTSYSVSATDDGFVVDAVTVRGIDAACGGGQVHVELGDAAGTTIAAGSTPISADEETVVLATRPAPTQVAGVHVVLSR